MKTKIEYLSSNLLYYSIIFKINTIGIHAQKTVCKTIALLGELVKIGQGQTTQKCQIPVYKYTKIFYDLNKIVQGYATQILTTSIQN